MPPPPPSPSPLNTCSVHWNISDIKVYLQRSCIGLLKIKDTLLQIGETFWSSVFNLLQSYVSVLTTVYIECCTEWTGTWEGTASQWLKGWKSWNNCRNFMWRTSICLQGSSFSLTLALCKVFLWVHRVLILMFSYRWIVPASVLC